eukprot:TRINITY_DN5774_c0_g1_i4.p1 TRINITY_DN5774_c0_g1~~TRINITY_DN5774_c0_g1_i4.p1  ORF type:complete len:349 (+),score=60.74 TRINITY_DN5774_c0_g1_i4:67-1113(+)
MAGFCVLLGLDESGAPALASFLGIKDVFSLVLASSDCHRLCRLAFRTIRLQGYGEAAADILLRLVQASLTNQGANIREIDASFCRSVTNDTLKALPKLLNLESLNLDGCQDVDDDGLVAVAQRFPGLRRFSVYWNVKATDKGIGRVLRAQPCGNLQELCLSGCKHITDETVQRITGRARQLRVLDITRCPKVTATGIVLICECLEQLKILRLYAMAQLDPPAFKALGELKLLEELDLCGCRIEDPAIEEFLASVSPSRLVTFNLTWCPSITDLSVLAIAKHCPCVTWLSVFGNTNITAAAVKTLADSPCGQKLRYLDVHGLTQAAEYSLNDDATRQLFPNVVQLDLHH